MRYVKKSKYKIDKTKLVIKKEQDLTAKELYQERLKNKRRLAKRR